MEDREWFWKKFIGGVGVFFAFLLTFFISIVYMLDTLFPGIQFPPWFYWVVLFGVVVFSVFVSVAAVDWFEQQLMAACMPRPRRYRSYRRYKR